MENKNTSSKIGEQLKNMVKGEGFSIFTAALMAIVLGLIFGFIVMIFANPAEAPYGFVTILTGGFSKLGNVFYYATPILMTGLAVGFAFKMGLFNIGASGQFSMGMFFSLYVALMWDLPPSIHLIVCILAGALGGMIWGIIPGFFKAYFNVNEVITSIMFNYIGIYLVDMWIKGNLVMYNPVTVRTRYIPISAQLPVLGFKDSDINISIFIAIGIAIILYIVLNKTTFGFELKATGFNKHAATYAGMNGKRNIVLTMAIAGALAGLGGAFMYLSGSTTIPGSSATYEPINIIAANGFNGIAVALLGNSSPIGIIFSAVFISFIQRGGTLAIEFKPEIIDVVIAVIIYFSAFAMLMNETLVKFLKKRKKKLNKPEGKEA